MTTKSYEIKVIDSEGRKLSLWILGECVDELINIYGDSEFGMTIQLTITLRARP
jgi:hypothetical protein